MHPFCNSNFIIQSLHKIGTTFGVQVTEQENNDYKELENYVIKLQKERNQLKTDYANLEENLLKVQEERNQYKKKVEELEANSHINIEDIASKISQAVAILNQIK